MAFDRGWLWRAYLAIGLLATGFYFVLPSGGIAQSYVFIGLAVLQLGAIGAGIAIARPARPAFWYLVFSGQALVLVGNVVWYVYPITHNVQPAFPSISDGIFLGSYAVSAAALILLIRSRGGGQDGADFLDAAIITLGLAAISWVYLIAPYVRATDLDIFGRLVSIAYPLSDIVLLALAVRLGVSPGARTPVHWLVILWMASQLAADSLFAVLVLKNAFSFGSPNFAGWMLQVVFLGAAALHPSMARLTSPVTATPPAAFRSRLALLGGAALIPLALMLASPDDMLVLAGVSALLFLLVVVRMAGLMGRRLRMEAEMGKLSEERYRRAAEYQSVFMNIADGVVIRDKSGRVTFNPPAQQLLGVPIGESSESEWSEWYGLFLPDRKTAYPVADLPMTRAMLGEAVDDAQVFVRNPSVPSGVLLSVTARPLRGAGGELTGAVAVFRDITLRQRAEDALRRLASIVESSSDAILSRDLDGTILSWNPGAERLYGYSADEMIGRNVTRLLSPEDAEATKGLATRLKPGEPIELPDTIRLRKDGTRVHVSIAASPIRDATGKVVAVSAISRDITERKRAEEQIRQLNADLERKVAERTAALEASNKELEAFSYTVSHDLRAPLRAIDGFVGLLLRKHAAKLDGEAARYLGRVANGAQQMGRLIDDLLTFSRLSRTPLEKTSVDTPGVAQKAVEQLGPQMQGRKIELSVGPLPVCSCEPILLEQVFTNLIGNAIKFTKGRDPAQIQIGCRLDTATNEAVFFVRDNGAGFEMQYADKLFGVFQRLHRAEDFEGTGVGLAIVQRIVHRHNGRVWGEGEPGKGATFYFTLGGIAEWLPTAA